jgi:hypothetical protein
VKLSQMQATPASQDSETLRYAAPDALVHPLRSRASGIASVAVGCVAFAVNVLIAGAMGSQLLKQIRGFKGVSPLPIEPWLITTGIEAGLGALLSIFAVFIGAITLRHPGRGPRLHRRYAWLKLPLACVFGVCAGWGMTFYVSSQPRVIAAGGILAAIASATYPLFLLRILPRSRD